MSELKIQHEPAQTYQLNVLASALGRFAPTELDHTTVEQSREFCENVVEAIREDQKPAVPHNNEELLEEATAFDDKLLLQVRKGRAGVFLSASLLGAIDEIITDHQEACFQLQSQDGPQEMFVEPQVIADTYGLPDMWTDADTIIKAEVKEWAQYSSHPEIPEDLARPVSAEETEALMQLMWQHVVGVRDYPDIRTYLTEQPDFYHVYWAPLAETLDYATPAGYDRATQLSFDLPHNATHLAHLDVVDPALGVFRYDDSMAQRAFFEAAAVYSEIRGMEEARTNPEFTAELSEALDLQSMSSEELAKWIAQDRGYEFKLRAARYAADALMIRGASFEETVHEVADTLQIPLTDAEKEARKYIAWTGLGAVYTAGYRKLQQAGVKKVKDVLVDSNGRAITSWRQFEDQGSEEAQV